MTRTRFAAAAAALLAALVVNRPAAAGPSRADPPHEEPVAHWNTVAAQAYAPTQGTQPLPQSRTFAILHAAIHDALNAIDRRFVPYTPGLAAAPGASVDAAVATAAREVLVALIPDQAALVDDAYYRVFIGIPEGPAKAAGIAVGRAAAQATLNRRATDGIDRVTQPVYVPKAIAGDYQFTAPFDLALVPGWGRLEPFAIDLAAHRLDGPLPITSPEYARDLAYLQSIGGRASTTRTAEQSTIAQFWYEDSPLGWNRITNIVVRQRGLDSWAAARAFALVNFALADGYIAGFEAKYRFRFWRPVTAIRAAGEDGNPDTKVDPAWQPFLTTPPVPDYPSTHTVVGAAAAEVLIALFGDTVDYDTTSLTLPGVTRHYTGFSAAARENGLSRVYAGIHFQHAVKDGHTQGRSIGRAVTGALAAVN
jgi:membrane-associated phospholipid phosphatase